MSHNAECRGYFLEWIGTSRRDVAPVPPAAVALRLEADVAWFYLYRCPRCSTVFASRSEPRAGDKERWDADLGVMGYEL